ncbi:MAG: hypothetical protein GF333_06695 [Candidatus Omnitrophica bacterium]|nr:hypothetical protein [Candidatus Omnitrophota bacterium]
MKGFVNTAGQMIFTLVLYAFGVVILGLSIFPGVMLCVKVWGVAAAGILPARVLFLCLAMTTAYFIAGFCLMLLVGIIRIVFRLSLKEGEYPLYSFGAMKWAFINSLVLVVSNVFMDFILLTPFVNAFYRLMGAKLGVNVQINSKYCADLSLLEIGDEAVIGGHATVIGHSVERGRLILKKVRIGRRAVIGLNAVVLPGARIGDGAVIAAGSVLGRNMSVEPRSVYCGVPAMSTRQRRQGRNEQRSKKLGGR